MGEFAPRYVSPLQYQPEELRARGLVYDTATLPEEAGIRLDFDSRFMGAVALLGEAAQVPRDGFTFAESIDGAALGDPESEQRMDINIGSAVAEGVLKDNHRTLVRKTVGPGNKVMQFGMPLHNMHFNAVAHRRGRHPQLLRRDTAEAHNGYREQAYYEAGLLRDNILIVASCVAQGLPEKLLDSRGEGLFTRTMTYSLQGTTQEGSDVTTETIFRAGTSASHKDSYQERVAKRYDIAAIGLVYEWLGQEAPQTDQEFLERPLLVHKSLLPNGMVDFLRLCDMATDQILGVQQERPVEQYIQIIADSAVREASLAGVRAAVKKDLLAAAGTFDQPTEANQLLWDLVKEHAFYEAGTNLHIDPIVFGSDERVQQAIIEARNNPDRAREILAPVLRYATIGGCGGGSNGNDPNNPNASGPGEGEQRQATGETAGASALEKVTCPNCDVRVYLDAKKLDAGILYCSNCKTNQPICGGPAYKDRELADSSIGEALAASIMDYLGSLASKESESTKRELVPSA